MSAMATHETASPDDAERKLASVRSGVEGQSSGVRKRKQDRFVGVDEAERMIRDLEYRVWLLRQRGSQ